MGILSPYLTKKILKLIHLIKLSLLRLPSLFWIDFSGIESYNSQATVLRQAGFESHTFKRVWNL